MNKIILEHEHILDVASLSEITQKNIKNLVGNETATVFYYSVSEITNLFNVDNSESLNFYNFLFLNKDNEYYKMKNISTEKFIFITTNNDLTFQIICDALAEDFAVNKEIFEDLGIDENRHLIKPVLVNYIRQELLKKTLHQKELESSRVKSKI